jgi:hypothetical protein
VQVVHKHFQALTFCELCCWAFVKEGIWKRYPILFGSELWTSNLASCRSIHIDYPDAERIHSASFSQ